jgi:hypothetical protein
VSHLKSLIGCTALHKALQTVPRVLKNCKLYKFELELGGVRQARALVQRMGDAREPQQQAAVVGSPPRKINLISCGPLGHVSDIKLIRTDTTLDLSQKAEKGMLDPLLGFALYNSISLPLSSRLLHVGRVTQESRPTRQH